MSLRCCGRVGSGLSVGSSTSKETSVLGGKTSVIDCLEMGSSLSLRSFTNIGGKASMLDYFNIGS